MINVKKLRDLKEPKVLAIGNHAGIIQSILDFDYLNGNAQPSIVTIVGVQQRFIRYFFGDKEVLIPGSATFEELNSDISGAIDLFVVAQSGRRVLEVSEQALKLFPKAAGGLIFAEGVPEIHALRLRKLAIAANKFILGPASVGMAIGGRFKLGAIGGTLPEQIASSGILDEGSVAIVSTSGGMINEIISLVTKSGHSVSFAAAVGGERFPITTPVELVAQAIDDKATNAIAFFGELGGTDEYEIAKLLKESGTKKPFVAYIAGVVAEMFESAPQFGHAKALAQHQSETASAKKRVLKENGALVADSFADFEKLINSLERTTTIKDTSDINERLEVISTRSAALFHDGISTDKGGEVKILGEPLLDYIEDRSLSDIALGMFLGHNPKSRVTAEFFDTCLRLLVDHGPQVSGAVNTMITARAGKDLPAALATGILTIGSRFGGAMDQSAENWLDAVSKNEPANLFVERFASQRQYVAGIGHKKYRLDNPDPRVATLLERFDKNGKYTTFAKEVARITTNKKAQLILNVDGAVAALLLDILSNEEGYNESQIRALIKTEFCNAIFVYARSVGFIAHYLEQRRLDEGLFRLPDDLISS